MKKIITFTLLLLAATTSFAQWQFKSTSDGVTAYVKSNDDPNKATLMFTNTSLGLILGMQSDTYVYDSIKVEFIFEINGQKKAYIFSGVHALNDDDYYSIWIFPYKNFNNLRDASKIWDDEFVSDFKTASKLSVRLTEYLLEKFAKTYTFNMKGSTKAYNTVNNSK